MLAFLIIVGVFALFAFLIELVMRAEEDYIRNKNALRKSLQNPVVFQKRTFGFKHHREKFPSFEEE